MNCSDLVIGISTHSLTRRLTGCPDADMQFLFYFNSQPHKEADVRLITYLTFLIHFNSQPHKEADAGYVIHDNSLIISTHSLTRRLTIGNQGSICMDAFQLTASQGG